MAAVSIYNYGVTYMHMENAYGFGSDIYFMVLILLHTSKCVHHNYAILTNVFIK